MFHYYGRKKKIATRYPEAIHSRIVEPFAGSAAYACLPQHRSRDVVLIELDPVVHGAWSRLLAYSDAELSRLPRLKVGDVVSDHLIMLHMASKRWWTYRKITVTPIIAANWDVSRRTWPSLIPQIRHWDIRLGSYTEADNVEATWFIDPPYIGDRGTGYRHGSANLDYSKLAEWCRSRHGQVIVCGGAEDTWLPFQPLTSLVGVAGKRSYEGIFSARSAMADAQHF